MFDKTIDALLHPSSLTLMTEIVIGLLIVATIIILLLPRINPRANSPELKARVKSWWVMVGLFILAITVNTNLSIVFIAMLSFVALKEYFTLVHLRLADRRAILLAYLAIPFQYWWVYYKEGWYGMFLVFIPVYMFLLIPFRLVLTGDPQRFMTSAGKLHWGLMAFVFGISHLAYFLVLDMNPAFPFEAGTRGILFYLVFLTEFNDVLQFLWGKTLGKHKMAPTISPGKTWEGFIGGIICTMILAIVLRFLTPMDWMMAALAGLIIAVVGLMGDLIISAIKRDVGVKDSGSIIPGHGGVLDRVDSLCFTTPVFFHFMYYFYGA